MTTKEFAKALTRFIDLARRGSGGGASGGEIRAAALAEAILEHAPGLDDEALEGAYCFMRASSRCWPQMNELLRGKEVSG